jgi:hypothetical protein
VMLLRGSLVLCLNLTEIGRVRGARACVRHGEARGRVVLLRQDAGPDAERGAEEARDRPVRTLPGDRPAEGRHSENLLTSRGLVNWDLGPHKADPRQSSPDNLMLTSAVKSVPGGHFYAGSIPQSRSERLRYAYPSIPLNRSLRGLGWCGARRSGFIGRTWTGIRPRSAATVRSGAPSAAASGSDSTPPTSTERRRCLLRACESFVRGTIGMWSVTF